MTQVSTEQQSSENIAGNPTEIPYEFRLATYEYELPPDLVAQEPEKVRDESRLMMINRKNSLITHHSFKDLPELLHETDVLVLNETAVIPVLLKAHKCTGGSVELLVLDPAIPMRPDKFEKTTVRECLVKTSKPLKTGAEILIDRHIRLVVFQALRPGRALVHFPCKNDELLDFLRVYGHAPLPPYIKPKKGSITEHKSRYQTVYSKRPGSVAAPTAGLHFTDGLLQRVAARGVSIARITLHVGLGTFLPMRDPDIRFHKMETEFFDISEDTANVINSAIRSGGRIVTVGSTSMRTLESAVKDNDSVMFGRQYTDLFIKPGYKFKIAGAMITNFHLPHSTLLALVSSFAGIPMIKEAYLEAVKQRYRFFSYGDASIII